MIMKEYLTVSKALEKAYPELHQFIGEYCCRLGVVVSSLQRDFIVRDSNFFVELRQFFDDLAASKKFHPVNAPNWWSSLTTRDITALKVYMRVHVCVCACVTLCQRMRVCTDPQHQGGHDVIKVHKNKWKALSAAYPEIEGPISEYCNT